MTSPTYENVKICETIISLSEAREFMSENFVSKDDKITTYLEPYDKINLAIRKQILLLAYENGLILEES